MRDKKRIPDFLKKLGDQWQRVPDWRFGQLMMNVLGDIYSATKIDPFFPEEEEMIRLITESLDRIVGVGDGKDENK